MKDRLCALEEHLTCGFFLDNSPDPLVKTIDLLEGEIVERKSEVYETVLLISGSIALSENKLTDLHIPRESLFLLPPGDGIQVRGLEPASLIVFRMIEEVRFCHKVEVDDFQLFEQKRPPFYMLPFKRPIVRFAESLLANMKSGLRCEKYLIAKLTELMFLLRGYYSKSELATFFQLFLRKSTDFQTRILNMENEVTTVKEMAEKCHMTEVGFRKKFKQEMGMPPKEYLINRKKRLIIKDLRNGVKSNGQLCEEYGFTSASSFNNFCRTHLGGRPSDLRKIISDQ